MPHDIPEDIMRAKASNIGVPQPKMNIYTEEPSRIDIEHRFKLIKDPQDYEIEYKKRNVWSYRDIKTFIVELFKQNKKNFEKLGELLPHKTAKELVFFYHTFKKLLKFKNEIKNSREI